MDRTPTDYTKTPSYEQPASYEEARLAMIHEAHRALSTPAYDGLPLSARIISSPARTAQQARWLDDARNSILAGFGDVLNAMAADIDHDEIRAARGQ